MNSHECVNSAGQILLTKILVTTASCVDCTEEGAELDILGKAAITCKTNTLDHPDEVDYASSGQFNTAVDDREEDGWGGCYRVSIDMTLFLF